MAKRTSKLELDAIIKGKIPKRYPLGDGLYFTIKKSGAMSFGIRYQINGEPDYKGLGAYDKVNNNLGIARAKCEAYRVQIKQGINPKIEEQKEADLKRSAKALADQLKDSTFAKYAYKHIKNLEPSWTNIKTAAQWRSSLEQYAFSVIGDTPVSDVSRTQVLTILEPIWFEKTETADRVRRRIAAILDAAISDDLRTERNPAIWRGSLHGKLPSVESVKNAKAPPEERAHPSLQYSDLPLFMDALSEQDGAGARARARARARSYCLSILIGPKSGEDLVFFKVARVPRETFKQLLIRLKIFLLSSSARYRSNSVLHSASDCSKRCTRVLSSAESRS